MNGQPAAVVPLERYVDARELAQLMGVSPTTIKRMVAAGMPSETWGMARTRRFLPSQAIAWASRRSPGTMMAARDGVHNTAGEHEPKE